MSDLIPIAASLTSAAKNVYDIATDMISTRKQNRLITSAQIRRFKNAIDEALERERQKARIEGVHALETSARNMIIDSYKQVESYGNSPIGIMLLETVRDEMRFLQGYVDDYDRNTKVGGLH